MKLRDGFITYEGDNEHIMVAAGAAAGSFHGMVRSNGTAAFMIENLKKDISRDELIRIVMNRYEDAPMELVANDVDKIIASLRQIGALDE